MASAPVARSAPPAPMPPAPDATERTEIARAVERTTSRRSRFRVADNFAPEHSDELCVKKFYLLTANVCSCRSIIPLMS